MSFNRDLNLLLVSGLPGAVERSLESQNPLTMGQGHWGSKPT